MRLKPLDEQVVVVFGASSGIGRETALRFARHGARVVVAARSEEGLQSLVEEIEAGGGQAEAVVADVVKFEQVQAVADRAVEVFGRLDTWVHVAAISVYATFEDTTPEEFRRVLEVNLLGQIHGAKAALPHLKQTGRGALIHVSSIEARRALPFHSAYASSKHGIKGFLETLRLELKEASVPVSVTEVMPASINTPLFNKSRTKLGVKPMGPPPYYEPSVVVDVIVQAAQHPKREAFAGGAAKMFDVSEKISPRLTDALLRLIAFGGSKTDEPKSADAPDNVDAPIQGFDQVRGDFDRLSFRHSLYSAISVRPWARRALGGVAAGAVLLAAGRFWKK